MEVSHNRVPTRMEDDTKQKIYTNIDVFTKTLFFFSFFPFFYKEIQHGIIEKLPKGYNESI